MNALNPFQWIALTCLLIALLAEAFVAFRVHVHRGFWTLRVAIWICAAVAIYNPANLTRLARILGIDRGTDLLLYATVLLFFAISLFLYVRCKHLQRQITNIVRHIAINEAKLPTSANDQFNLDSEV